MSIQVDDYVFPREINWIQIIEDIKAEYGTYSCIAKALGVEWSTVQGWRQGCEPRFTNGSGLLMIHAKICGGKRTQQRIAEAA